VDGGNLLSKNLDSERDCLVRKEVGIYIYSMQLLQIVDKNATYNLWKTQIDSIKIEA